MVTMSSNSMEKKENLPPLPGYRSPDNVNATTPAPRGPMLLQDIW